LEALLNSDDPRNLEDVEHCAKTNLQEQVLSAVLWPVLIFKPSA
jgi:hypothetical protein